MSGASIPAEPTEADRAGIVALLHALAMAADLSPDDQLNEHYRSCFTNDAVWEMHTVTQSDRRVGISEIMRGVAERRSAGRNGPTTGVRHHITTTVITAVARGTWSAESYYLVTGPSGEVRSVGRYCDTVVVDDGRFRVAARAVHVGAPTQST